MDFWDKVSDLYDMAEGFNGKVYREMTDTVRRLVPEGAAVLDCAAGTGELSLAAAERAGSVVCTDLSLRMLSNARRKAAARGLDNIEFEKRNIFDLRDSDETYDVTIAGNVLHLLQNPEGAVKELLRVTKKGGRVLLPTFMTQGKQNGFFMKVYRRMGFDPVYNWTPAEYKRLLTGMDCGEVKVKLIRGMIPCAFAVIKKPL